MRVRSKRRAKYTFTSNTANDRTALDQTYHVYFPKLRNSTADP